MIGTVRMVHMNTEKISVIVPVYHVEKFLKKCVESILSQTHRNLEVILVNDASSDKCREICQEFAEKDDRVIVVHHEKNKGVAAARNSGLDIATGDFVGFVDGDDWIEPDMYEHLLHSLIKYEVDIAQCSGCLEDTDGQLLSEEMKSKGTNVYDKRTAVNQFFEHEINHSLCMKLLSRKIIGNFRLNEQYKQAEDALFIYYLLKQEAKVVTTNVSKYHYVRHSGSCTTKFNETYFDHLAVCHLMLQEEGEESTFRRGALRHYTFSMLRAIEAIQKQNICKERIGILRRNLLKYGREIITEQSFSKDVKLKVILLKYCPLLDNMIVRVRYNKLLQ